MKLRKIYDLLIGASGTVLTIYSVFWWARLGFGMNGILAYKNTFGNHPLHLTLVGLLMILYCIVDLLIFRKTIGPASK